MFSLDRSLFYFLYNIGQRIGADWLFIFFATYLPIFITLVFLWLLYKKGGDIKRKIYLFGFTFLGIIISRGVLTEVIRYFFPRIRPFIELNLTPMLVDSAYSFPSGHTTFLFIIAFSAFLIDKKWGWILSLTSLLAVFSRVVAGVHWPSDIIGGIIIAGAVFVVMYYWILPPKKIILEKDKSETSLTNE
jgi:undecaprenyl-diphosphatase